MMIDLSLQCFPGIFSGFESPCSFSGKMALVPWVYNNPRTITADRQPLRQFLFQGKVIEVSQDVDAEINATQNTALRLWDGAFLLARYIENRDAFPIGFWSGLRCLELGAGCGLVGLVAWLLGCDVTLTDLPCATSHTLRSVTANVARLAEADSVLAERKSSIRVKDYTWGEESPELRSCAPYDVILGSDIIYCAESASCLVDALKTMSSENTLILLSYKRRCLGEEVFFDRLAAGNFKYEIIPRNLHPCDFSNSEYDIYRVFG
jgi:predicted nicotinamide N-methyase